MPHSLLGEALIISEKRPRRSLFSIFVHRYSLIFGVLVTLITAASAFHYAPVWTAGAIALYCLYYLARIFLEKRQILGMPYRSKWVQFGRSLLLIASISIFLGHLYLGTDYLAEHQGSDTLWLLFLLAIFIMSQYGITELMLATILFASAALVTLTLLTAPVWDLAMALDLSVKVLWLALLAFVLHILVRLIGDWYANVRLLHDTEEQIMQVRTTSDEKDLLDTAVQRIAGDFGYPHVNIFYLQPNGALKCVAGAGDAGRSLASAGYTQERGQGIIGYVAATGKPYRSNNVGQDRHFHLHPAFPNTKAELAVPIKLRGETIGVLDVQAHRTGLFFPQDLEVMEITAGHFGRVLDNVRQLKSKQRIARIVGSIASRFLSQHELAFTLDQIAWAAYEELAADVVVLYEQNPLTGVLSGAARAGELFAPEAVSLLNPDSSSMIYRLLAGANDYYFQANVADWESDPLFAPTEYHLRYDIPTFAEREKIASRVIICLRADTGRIGLLFLNFRTPRRFEEEDKNTFFTFAHLAALAIQKAQFHQQQIQFERETLARQLHDQFMANMDISSRLISTMLRDGIGSELQRSKLAVAQDAIQELKRDLKYLNETLRDSTFDNMPDEIAKLTRRATSAYGVDFEVSWMGHGQAVPRGIVSQYKMILNEAIINAIKHGAASRIGLAFDISNECVAVRIEDNGQGFDPARVRPSGLANMRERAQRLGGWCRIDSAVGKGTRIWVSVPCAGLKGEERLAG